MLVCDAPKSKGGVNFLDLKKLATEYGIEIPKNITKRALCKLINEKIDQSMANTSATSLKKTTTKTTTTINLTPPPQLKSLYKLEKKLGEGSFGEVWKATELSTGHIHALKLLKEIDDSTSREVTTLIEMGSAKNKCNKNVLCYVRQFEAFYKSRVYQIIVTDMIQGISLEEWRKNWYEQNQNPPPPATVRKIARGIFIALSFAHSYRVYHLDIKPANIMITDKNDAVVIDFGLSCTKLPQHLKISQENNCKEISGSGTLLYMSPEYLQFCRISNKPKDCKETTLAGTDVWAAGLSILELLHSHNPVYAISIKLTETNQSVKWLRTRSWLPDPIAPDDNKLSLALDGALASEETDRISPSKFLSLLNK